MRAAQAAMARLHTTSTGFVLFLLFRNKCALDLAGLHSTTLPARLAMALVISATSLRQAPKNLTLELGISITLPFVDRVVLIEANTVVICVVGSSNQDGVKIVQLSSMQFSMHCNLDSVLVVDDAQFEGVPRADAINR
jgi:hypothetical protein